MDKQTTRTPGVSTKMPGLNRANFALYRQNGIGAVEVSVADVDYDAQDLCAIVSDARAEGIDPWSFHLRFWPFEGYTIQLFDRDARHRSVEYAAEWIRRAGNAGFRHAVIHPSGEPIEDTDRAEAMKNSKESLAVLSEVAAKAGIILCVENLPRTCLAKNSAELLELLAVDSRMRACFDTNHLLSEPTLDFMEALGEKIVTLHLSDYDFMNERHWLPGDGLIDWRALMQKLDAIGYRGVMMYETAKTQKNGVERMLTPKDYAENASWLESLR